MSTPKLRPDTFDFSRYLLQPLGLTLADGTAERVQVHGRVLRPWPWVPRRRFRV